MPKTRLSMEVPQWQALLEKNMFGIIILAIVETLKRLFSIGIFSIKYSQKVKAHGKDYQQQQSLIISVP